MIFIISRALSSHDVSCFPRKLSSYFWETSRDSSARIDMKSNPFDVCLLSIVTSEVTRKQAFSILLHMSNFDVIRQMLWRRIRLNWVRWKLRKLPVDRILVIMFYAKQFITYIDKIYRRKYILISHANFTISTFLNRITPNLKKVYVYWILFFTFPYIYFTEIYPMQTFFYSSIIALTLLKLTFAPVFFSEVAKASAMLLENYLQASLTISIQLVLCRM